MGGSRLPASKVCQLSAGKRRSKRLPFQEACTGLPAPPMRMRSVLFGRTRHSVRAVFSMDIHELARKHSDGVSAPFSDVSAALLNHASRSQRAPPQPFRGQAREKFLVASSQVVCEFCPSNRRP